MSGKLGDQVVIRRLRDGRTIVCNKPDFSNRKLRKSQKEHHKRFQAASAYACEASCTNPIYAKLAEGTMKNAYNVALGDWCHAPVVQRVERRGKTIRMEATEDVLVTEVWVMILDKKEKVVEKGVALRKKGNWWEYVPGAEGKVVVEAEDLRKCGEGRIGRMRMKDKG